MTAEIDPTSCLSRRRFCRRTVREGRLSSRRPVHLSVLIVLLIISSSCSIAPPFRSDDGPTGTLPNPSEQDASGVNRAEPYYHFMRGYLHMIENDLDSALEHYRIAADKDPSSSYLYTQTALLLLRKNAPQEAKEACEAALALDPSNLQARLILAALYSTEGDHEAAIEQYESILEQDPVNQKMNELLDQGAVGPRIALPL